MQVFNIDTGRVHTLRLTDSKSGVNYIADFIHVVGGDNDFTHELDFDGNRTGRYVADTKTIEWWETRAKEQEEIDKEITALNEDLREVVDSQEAQSIMENLMDRVGNAELEDMHLVAMNEIEKIREEHSI